ncbi:hypothetical protein BJX70DRAFT_112055 [Aspergillus crustosus]
MATPDLTPQDQTTLSTLHLLESRLHRLTYLLTGDSNWTGNPLPPPKPASYEETVARRLQLLERSLERLREREGVVGDLLGVYDRFPELFNPSSTSTSTIQTPSSPDDTSPSPQDLEPDLSPESLHPPLEIQKSTILAYATTIPETASRLTSLTDTPIPPATLSASLISLQPRIASLAETQEKQAAEISELRLGRGSNLEI